MYIPVVLGTGRKGRYSAGVSHAVVEWLSNNGHKTELVDVRDSELMVTNNTEESVVAREWKQKVQNCKAFIIVTPEYNHSFPGELKLFLDQLRPSTYEGTAVGIISVSRGQWGGTRVTETLRLLLDNLRVDVAHNVVHVAKVHEKTSTDGIFNQDGFDRRLDRVVQELLSARRD